MLTRRSQAAVCLVCVWVLGLLVPTAVVAEPAVVTDEAGYQQLLEATTAAEVVRFEYGASPRPRVMATVAAIQVFVTRNPGASSDVVDAFGGAFDARLSSLYPSDADLVRPAHFFPAVRFGSDLTDDVSLGGFESALGDEVLEVLGYDLGAREQSTRLLDFKSFTLASLRNSSEVGQLLVSCFRGYDAADAPSAVLSDAVTAYLRGQGIEPFPSDLAGGYPEIAGARAQVPQTFSAFEVERAAGFANVRGAALAEIDAINLRLDQRVDEISADLAASPDLFQIPTQAQIDAADAERELARRERAASRSLLAFNSQVFSQSDDPSDRDQARIYRQFSGMTLQTNEAFDDAKSGLQIVGGVAQIAAGFATGDVVGAIGGLMEAIFGVFDLVGPGVPTPEEQIFEQIVEMRQQMEDMRMEMHVRFDRIDEKLDIIYEQMVTGLNQINATTMEIQADVEDLQRAVADLQSSLNRLEQNLYGMLSDGFQQTLVADINAALDYRERQGADMAYNGVSESFTVFHNTFYSWANDFSRDQTYAGPATMTLANDASVTDQLNNTELGFNINNLREFPTTYGRPALFGTRVANPTVWALAADAYATLARQNPWYFAALHSNDPSRLGDVRARGENVRTAMENAADPLLLEAMRAEYDVRLGTFVAEAAAAQEAFLDANSGVRMGGLDLWADATQSVAGMRFGPPFVFIEAQLEDGPPFGGGLPLPRASEDGNGHWELWPPALAIAIDYAPEVAFEDVAFRVSTTTTYLEGDDLTFDVEYWILVNGEELIRRTWSFNGWCRLCDGDPDDFLYIFYDGSLFDYCTGPLFFLPPGSEAEAGAPSAWGITSLGEQTTVINSSLLATIQAAADAAIEANRMTLGQGLVAELNGVSALRTAAQDLTASNAILDAYVSVALPELVEQSDVVRSTLRGDGLGQKMAELMFLGVYADETIQPPMGLETAITKRVDGLFNHMQPWLDSGEPQAHTYLEWTLANLDHLESRALRLARDDHYTTGVGTVLNVSGDGVLGNDVRQAIVSRDASLVTMPSNGSVMLDASGSFSYMPDAGFTGTDSFTYVTRGAIPAQGGQTVFVDSDPATVRIEVCDGACGEVAPSCPGDRDGDGETGILDLLDFLSAYFTQDPSGELTGDNPPMVDLFDLLVYLDSWFTGSLGC